MEIKVFETLTAFKTNEKKRQIFSTVILPMVEVVHILTFKLNIFQKINKTMVSFLCHPS